MPTLAYLLLGSNLGNRQETLCAAVAQLHQLAGPVVAQSGLYETAAWGLTDQPTFLNQAVAVATALPPAALLAACQQVEQHAGRTREIRWAARTLDVDILLYGQEIIDSPTLQVPHPRLPERRFALVPLAEIAPAAVHPGLGRTVAELLAACGDALGVERVASNESFSTEVDKLTRSIENAVSGERFETAILKLSPADSASLAPADWLFDWQVEAQRADIIVHKLVIQAEPTTIQGLIGLQDRGDHIFMSLIESSKHNRGIGKLYVGVPGNLVAFACKFSFEKGYEGYVSFESKTALKAHYQQTLDAHILFGSIMAIATQAALKLVKQYFPQSS